MGHVSLRLMQIITALAVSMLVSPAGSAETAAVEPLHLLGIPVDFILFGLTLLGVALLHHHTLQVALTGLAAITVYKLTFTGFKFGVGLAGLGLHLQHEWVILANLFLLLMGFALLSRHFEKSQVPDEMPAFLPDDWKGGFVLLVIVFVLSSVPRQHRRRADRRHDGAARLSRQGAHRLSRRHRRGLQCRRLRQRGRRHHDHDDVDRRRQPAERARSLRRSDRRASWSSAFRRPCSSTDISPIVKHAAQATRDRVGARWRSCVAILVVAIVANVIANLRFPRCSMPSR